MWYYINMLIKTKSEKETFNVGRKLAKKLKGGDVIGLIGKLGAGKTILVKGIANGLGIKKIVTSPTFILMKIYNIKKNKKIKYLCHIDAYRLKNSKDLFSIGANDWLKNKNVLTIIEWAEHVKDILPKNKLLIKIKFSKKRNERKIEIKNT